MSHLVRLKGNRMAKQYDVIVDWCRSWWDDRRALCVSCQPVRTPVRPLGIYGGQMNNTAAIENYPGFSSVLGPDLAEDMYKGATQFGAEYACSVTSVEDQGAIRQSPLIRIRMKLKLWLLPLVPNTAS